MAKRNPEPEGTRDSIRGTAAAFFTSRGVYATSLADIAQAAKLSKGTLYYHYPAKEALVLDIAERYFSEITGVIYSWIDGLGLETTAEQAVRALSSGLWRDRDSMRLYFALFSEALREDGALRELMRAKLKEWSVMLEVGALKLSGPGSQRFRDCSRGFLPLLDGFALHGVVNEGMDEDLLVDLLARD